MSNEFFKMPEKIFGVSSSLIKLFLLPLAIILLFLVSLGLVIIPRFDSIGSLQGSITKVKTAIKTTDDKRNYLISVDQDELARNESYLSSAVLQEKNSYLLIGVIRKIADSFNYRIKTFSINPVKLKDETDSLKVSNKDVAVRLPIDVVLEGPESEVINLLVSMENSLPIMFIDKIGMISRLGVSELTLTVSSYYVPDNQNLVSGNLTLTDLVPTKEENDLLSKISQFRQDDNLIKNLSEQGLEGKNYVDYSRDNPFNP